MVVPFYTPTSRIYPVSGFGLSVSLMWHVIVVLFCSSLLTMFNNLPMLIGHFCVICEETVEVFSPFLKLVYLLFVLLRCWSYVYILDRKSVSFVRYMYFLLTCCWLVCLTALKRNRRFFFLLSGCCDLFRKS